MVAERSPVNYVPNITTEWYQQEECEQNMPASLQDPPRHPFVGKPIPVFMLIAKG